MITATNTNPVYNVEYEDGSEVVWIDRKNLLNDKITKNFVIVPAWGDYNATVEAAKVIFRLSWN